MKRITKTYVVKTWKELTDEEKEIQKKNYSENLLIAWGDMLCIDFDFEIAALKQKLKYIKFDNVYVDDNSQGFWVDLVKNVECYINNKTKNIYGFDFTIRKYIDDITWVDIDNDCVEFEKLKTMTGYKTLAKELEKDFEIFKNGINELVKYHYDNLYYITEDFIESYFEDMEFEFEELL